MSYRELVTRAWRDNLLLSVLLELTYRCNLDCVLCYNNRRVRGQPLDLEQYQRLLDDLCELNVLHLTLSGGEPLCHPDFWAIADHARKRGFAIRIKSNGHAVDRALAYRLKQEIDPFMIEVSLHGARASTHERQTRVPGSFGRLLTAIAAMIEAGLRIRLNTPLTRWNETEIESLCAISDRLGVRIELDPDVTPRDDGDPSPIALAVSEAGLQQLAALHQPRPADGTPSPSATAIKPPTTSPPPSSRDSMRYACDKHCGAGSSGLAIDPYGQVYPCVQWRMPLGCLHFQDIKEIWWHSSALQEVRRLSSQLGVTLRKSAAAASMGLFCPGIAHSESGNPFHPYTTFVRRRAALATVDAPPATPLTERPTA